MKSPDRIILWLGVPKTTPKKIEILSKVFVKRLKDTCVRFGFNLPSGALDDLTFPTSDTESYGFAVMVAPSLKDVDAILANVHTFPLDKKSTIRACRLEEAFNIISGVSTLDSMLQSRVGPCLEMNYSVDLKDAWDWMCDEAQREQFLIRGGRDLQVFWLDGTTGEAELKDDGEQARLEKTGTSGEQSAMWTNGEASWSPMGTYLFTIHAKGVRLWGGENFRPMTRLQHLNVQQVLFSADETYVLTWDGRFGEEKSIRLHLTVSGSVLKTFKSPTYGPFGVQAWPLCRLSDDSKYLAFPHELGGILLYELPSLTETILPRNIGGGTNSLRFSWQPRQIPSLLAIWGPSNDESVVSRLSIMDVASQQVVCSKNLFAVGGIGKIRWQSSGTYCALVTRIMRRVMGKKRQIQTQMEIFRMKEKNMPVDSVVIDDEIIFFGWAYNNRFAILTNNRTAIFYTLTPQGCVAVATLEIPREVNKLLWSRTSNYFVLASTTDSSGILWFGQLVDDPTKHFSVNIIHKDEMSDLTDVKWDPTGRFVLTSVGAPVTCTTLYKIASTAGYRIWTFQGRLLLSVNKERLSQAKWRPHPISVFDAKERKALIANINEIAEKLEYYDTHKRNKRLTDLQAGKLETYKQFEAELNAASSWYKSQPEYQEWEEHQRIFEEQHPYEESVIETVEEIEVVVKPTYGGVVAGESATTSTTKKK